MEKISVSLLLRLKQSQMEQLNQAYRQFLIHGELISRSEFIRRKLLELIEQAPE